MMRGTIAVAGLSWREAWRGRLWLVPVFGAAVVWALAPTVDAADPGGAVRLLAAAAGAAAGFCGILLAALVPAAQLTRDLESRVALTVLPKPLPRIGWLLGRWFGGVAMAGCAALVVALAGSAAVSWRAGGVPVMREAAPPQEFQRLTALGETVPVPQGVCRLTGPAGDGGSWIFSGLDPAASDGLEVLVRARTGANGGGMVEGTPVRVTCRGAGGVAIPLELDPASPYGRAPEDATSAGANAWLVDRTAERRSLASDWARLRLPAEAVGADGRLVVQVVRLDPSTWLECTRDGCALARPAGPQPVHAARAVLAELATPAVIVAAALAVAAVASLPVALLAALTLAFAGHALWAVREALDFDRHGRAVVRLLELALAGLPDFAATGQGVRLAAGEAVSWAHVGGAWLAVAPHLIVLLVLGWWALRRRQL